MNLLSPKPMYFFCEDAASCHSTLLTFMDQLAELYTADLEQHLPGYTLRVELPVYMLFDTMHEYVHTPTYFEDHANRAKMCKLRLVRLEWKSRLFLDVLSEGSMLINLPDNTRLAQVVVHIAKI